MFLLHPAPNRTIDSRQDRVWVDGLEEHVGIAFGAQRGNIGAGSGRGAGDDGDVRVAGSDRRRANSSGPQSLGIAKSSTIASGDASPRAARASTPSTASRTV